jgi:2-methylcitrate dehydratase PrpD
MESKFRKERLTMDRTESKIIEFLSDVSMEKLPESVAYEAKSAMLDTLGCIIAGVDTPIGRRLFKLCARFGDPHGSTVVGVKEPVIHFIAAMCNSFLANAHDADDGHRMSRLHAGGVIIPTVMAVAEEGNCNGSKFIEAVVIGYELGIRAGMASTEGDTYFGSAFGSTFGAAAAAGWLLGLPPDKIIDAMGISEMHAPNCMLMNWINSRKIPMIKEGMGWSAASGIMATYMAEQGITGTLTIFNGREELSRINHLGREFEIEKRYYKPYPGCRWSHGPRQTLIALVDKHNLKVDDVESVEVATFTKAAQLDNPSPSTMEEAEYSIPFILGASLAEGLFGPDQMIEEKLSDPRIIEQARKISLKVKSEFDQKYPAQALATLHIKTKDGREFSAKSERSRGDWDYPLSDEQLKEKFALMSCNRIRPDQVDAIINRIWSLESESGINGLLDLINKFVF